LLNEGGEVLEHAGHIVELKAEAYGDAVLVFLLQGADFAAVAVVVGDGIGVFEGQGRVAAEAEGREAVGGEALPSQ